MSSNVSETENVHNNNQWSWKNTSQDLPSTWTKWNIKKKTKLSQEKPDIKGGISFFSKFSIFVLKGQIYFDFKENHIISSHFPGVILNDVWVLVILDSGLNPNSYTLLHTMSK